MKVIDQHLLDLLSAEAAANPRLRKNRNFHPTDDARCHRLLNAIEPGSYIRPHRHLDPAKDEAFVILRGRLAVFIFDEDGAVGETAVLSPGGANVAADVPNGLFHTAVALESGTVFFEAKAGPYLPVSEEEKAPWAPEEGTPQAEAYLALLTARV